ncbi:hypothetical protein KKF23_01285 [Patescibacteria group bacterium]|nr:hypothetical protein [Patescibacteria group bacterium]
MMQKYLNYKILYLSLIMLCLISFCGAVVYRFYSLNNIGVAISLTLAVVLFIIILKFSKISNIPALPAGNTRQYKKAKTEKILLISYLLLSAICFFILFSHRTAEAIISPWQVAPSYFFIFYGLATAALIFNILKYQRFSLLLITLHYFLSFSIAWIVYKIGYGFDPFIHQATMDLIDKTGAVEPKPFYYLGQYSLIVILHKITFIPIQWLDKLLVPVLAAVFLPATLYRVLARWFDSGKANLLLVLIMLILPFSFFIATTPQNLAYLLLILAVLLGLICSNAYELIIIYLLAFAALFIQPIAGIPAALFALLLTAYHSDKGKLKKYFYLIIFILAVTLLPLAFYFVEKNNSVQEAELPLQNKIISLPELTVPDQENFILNFIYLYGFNLKIIIGLIIIAGLIIAFRHKQKCKVFSIYFLMSAALLLSYLMAKALPFNFLINYERDNYSDRILLAAVFFSLPFIIIALYAFLEKVLKQNRVIKTSLLAFLAVLTAVSLYLSYPRFDRYFNSHCFSTSASDIAAARWIDGNAGGDYIVLANQQVSAAALREFGFKKYYDNTTFYYPIPTGGPLYQYYLDMVYKKPSRETMIAAMDLTGVNESYFVLNKYWWAFPKILEEAKLEADGWQEIGGGEIYVFRYTR